VFRSLKTGISGYLLKTADYSEIAVAVKAVVGGKNYFCEQVIQNIKSNSKKPANLDTYTFTMREKEVLKFLCTGLSTDDVAEKLFLSRRTVEKHKQNLMAKTGSHSTSSLILFAINNSLT
jgi:DNA-binding NarL/FixJ family response regulator